MTNVPIEYFDEKIITELKNNFSSAKTTYASIKIKNYLYDIQCLCPSKTDSGDYKTPRLPRKSFEEKADYFKFIVFSERDRQNKLLAYHMLKNERGIGNSWLKCNLQT